MVNRSAIRKARVYKKVSILPNPVSPNVFTKEDRSSAPVNTARGTCRAGGRELLIRDSTISVFDWCAMPDEPFSTQAVSLLILPQITRSCLLSFIQT